MRVYAFLVLALLAIFYVGESAFSGTSELSIGDAALISGADCTGTNGVFGSKKCKTIASCEGPFTACEDSMGECPTGGEYETSIGGIQNCSGAASTAYLCHHDDEEACVEIQYCYEDEIMGCTSSELTYDEVCAPAFCEELINH